MHYNALDQFIFHLVSPASYYLFLFKTYEELQAEKPFLRSSIRDL